MSRKIDIIDKIIHGKNTHSVHINDILGKINIFSTLTKKEINKLIPIVKKKSVKEGEIIVKEGAKTGFLYILEKGIIEISKKTSLGESYIISVRDSEKTGSSSFGELSLIHGSKSASTIVAKTDSLLYFIEAKSFNKFCDEHTDIGYKIIKELSINVCKYLKSSNEQVRTLFDALIEETKRGIES